MLVMVTSSLCGSLTHAGHTKLLARAVAQGHFGNVMQTFSEHFTMRSGGLLASTKLTRKHTMPPTGGTLGSCTVTVVLFPGKSGEPKVIGLGVGDAVMAPGGNWLLGRGVNCSVFTGTFIKLVTFTFTVYGPPGTSGHCGLLAVAIMQQSRRTVTAPMATFETP